MAVTTMSMTVNVFAEEEAEYRLSIIEENYCTIDNEEKREEIPKEEQVSLNDFFDEFKI